METPEHMTNAAVTTAHDLLNGMIRQGAIINQLQAQIQQLSNPEADNANRERESDGRTTEVDS